MDVLSLLGTRIEGQSRVLTKWVLYSVPAHSDYLHLSIALQLSQIQNKRQHSMSGSHLRAGCTYKQQQQVKGQLQVIFLKKGFFWLQKKTKPPSLCSRRKGLVSNSKWQKVIFVQYTHTFRHNIWIKKIGRWNSLSDSGGAEAELICTPWASFLLLEAVFECSQSTGKPCRTGGWQGTGRGLEEDWYVWTSVSPSIARIKLYDMKTRDWASNLSEESLRELSIIIIKRYFMSWHQLRQVMFIKVCTFPSFTPHHWNLSRSWSNGPSFVGYRQGKHAWNMTEKVVFLCWWYEFKWLQSPWVVDNTGNAH